MDNFAKTKVKRGIPNAASTLIPLIISNLKIPGNGCKVRTYFRGVNTNNFYFFMFYFLFDPYFRGLSERYNDSERCDWKESCLNIVTWW